MKIKLLSILMALLTAITASAYDFSVANDDGVTLSYTITSANKLTVEVAMCPTAKYIGAVNIPSTVTSSGKKYTVTAIGELAFYLQFDMTSVTIPNSVTLIKRRAFDHCGLTSLTIPNSVTEIGASAFYYCSSLTSAIIGNSVTSIGTQAFSDCYALTSVTLGNSVVTIGDSAFSKCESLISVTIPNSVTTIEGYAFSKCASLISVSIGNSVTSIGSRAFASCTGLSSMTIPNSVTSIGNHALYGCSGMLSLVLGEGLTNVGEEAFHDCDNLKDVWSMNPTPPACTTPYDFSDTTYQLATLHVPEGTTEAYRVARAWKEFNSIVENASGLDVIDTGTEGAVLLSTVGEHIAVSGCGDGEEVAVYDLSGAQLYAGATIEGYYVIPVPLTKGNIYLVAIGSRTVKYRL